MIRFIKNKSIPFGCIFLGLLALIVGITSLSHRNTYTPIKATITRIEEWYDPTEQKDSYRTFAKYYVDGAEYEVDIGYHSPNFEEGKVIEIRYNPNDPLKVEAAPAGILIYFSVIGIALTAIGVFQLIRK